MIGARLLTTLSKTGICKKPVPALKNAQVESASDVESDSNNQMLVEEELHSGGRIRSSLNRSSKEYIKKSPRDKSADMEYKTVMAQLKHPNRSTTLNDDTYESLNCAASYSNTLI
ncbi:tonsoku-like protein [Anastrepha obliqua]|uniref:tonsoku-like protein n=1 Tax=Anastrepha obliqua TaxID=95512 RepID=UPI0024099998|nr:tonsoku-like protein [Anastrepha obliqua]